MAIRVREVEKNTFAEMKTWLENVLKDRTALTDFSFDYEQAGGNMRGTLMQVFYSVAAKVFTGSGLDDLTSSGTYTGAEDALFQVEIDATGTPDTFKWRKDAGSWTTGVGITGSAQSLSEGVSIIFGATTGHTVTDYWSIQTMIA